MKTVYFVQHGIALTGDQDATRPLSNSGVSEVRKVAEFLRDHGVVITRIFHSGKLRSQQTAELFDQVLNSAQISVQGGMAPGDEPSGLITQLNHNNALYVGHLPQLQKVVSQLIAGSQNAAAITFQNAAVACVEIEAGSASLKWFITPDLC